MPLVVKYGCRRNRVIVGRSLGSMDKHFSTRLRNFGSCMAFTLGLKDGVLNVLVTTEGGLRKK